MALGINTVWEARSGANAANVNGCTFNPEVTNLLTNLTTDASTGDTATPVVSSASYNFVAGDVNAYLFIQAGTNWRPGWYQITSVASNKATLDAAIGSGVWYTSGIARSFAVSTAAGVATVGTPTSGTFTIDYSQQNSHVISLTDLACTTPSTTVTSATGSFTPVMVGNGLKINTAISGAGGLTGFFEIVNYTSTTAVVLDRTPSPTTTGTGGVFRVGGAASLQSAGGTTDDILLETLLGTNGSGAHVLFIKNGTFTMTSSASISAAGGTRAPIRVVGYNTNRAEGFTTNLGANRPTINYGSFTLTLGTSWELHNLNFKGTVFSGHIITLGQGNKVVRCKVVHNGTTGGRCFSVGNASVVLIEVEGVSCRSNVILTSSTAASINMDSCYFHDSVLAISTASTTGKFSITNCIFSHNVTDAIVFTGSFDAIFSLFSNNTFYGAESKRGTGINFSATGAIPRIMVRNNIFYGLATPVITPSAQHASQGMSDFNNYFNNTNANTFFPTSSNDIAVDPSFASVTQRSGSTATTGASNTFTQTGATFQTWGITPGVDFLVLTAGSGTTNNISYSILSVDSETQLTLGETISASATADHVWSIVQGYNFGVGSNVAGEGGPGIFPGSSTVGYPDIGAVQRNPTSGMLYIPNLEGT